MAVTTISLLQPQNNGNNNAAIKTWGAALSSLFSGAGLVQTSDTGQINWSTTTATPNTTTSSDALIGYEIWKFNDSLQSTKPVFLRVEYRNIDSSVSTLQFYLAISVYVATNGGGANAGTYSLSFRVTQGTSSTGSVASPTAAVPAFSSGDGSSFVLAIGVFGSATSSAAANALGTFYIDRTRDASGAISGEGAVAAATGWNGGYGQAGNAAVAGAGQYGVMQFTLGSSYSIGSTGGIASTGIVLPAYVPTSLASGTTLGFSAPTVVCNGKKLPPILAAIAYNNVDTNPNSTVSVLVSGTVHTYYLLGSFCPCADRVGGSTTAVLAVRYE